MPVRFLMLALLLTLSACRSSESPLDVLATYQERANRHEVDRLMAMYADDARLDFGPMGVLEDQDHIRALHDYDRALNTTLRLEDCRLDNRSVTCRTIERNDWLKTAGIDRLVYTASVFTFNEANQIAAISATLAPASADSMGSAMARFGAWAQEHEADNYAALFREDGSFKFSYESGERVLALLKQWRAASQEE